ncbi:hypothetical protein FQN54_004078 [Arachnomyces sp. PD_36]|nr:hypothetical protein FQN54_004078 [Arachnomyces sp. PD_36]
MPSERSLQTSAALMAVISLGHTVTANAFMSDPQFRRLPHTVSTFSRAGWFQGSVYLLVSALINYRWSRNPKALTDPIEKAIAGLLAAVLAGSAVWYKKKGISGTSAVVAIGSAVQAWAAFGS